MSNIDTTDNIYIIGAGISSVFSILSLLENGYPGEKIYVIEKGKDPSRRTSKDVMNGFMGAGGYSDGKILYSLTRGGDILKYSNMKEINEYINKIKYYVNSFHPNPEKIISTSIEDNEQITYEKLKFITDVAPELVLLQNPLDYIGTNYLLQISMKIYKFMKLKNVNFMFDTEVIDINFNSNTIYCKYTNNPNMESIKYNYDKLFIGVGRSGYNLIFKLINKYSLQTLPRSAQIGIRFESDLKYFKKLSDLQYDFKLNKEYSVPYTPEFNILNTNQNINNHNNIKMISDKINIRTFCVNNKAAYVTKENNSTKLLSFNGHAYNGIQYHNDLINFGIIADIPVNNPLILTNLIVESINKLDLENEQEYSGKILNQLNRKLSLNDISSGIVQYKSSYDFFNIIKLTYGETLCKLMIDFIDNLNNVFKFDLDYVIYSPEVKYLNNIINVNNNLSLIDYNNVYLIGDCLSARGIFVSACHGLHVSKHMNDNTKMDNI